MGDYNTIRYEEPDRWIARIVLARPEKANAQSRELLYELDDALMRAAHDDGVKVVILAGEGRHFSSGHDLSDDRPLSEFEPVGVWGGFTQPGVEGFMGSEQEIYLGMCWRWRDMPKPTIAEVQGKVMLGGLMLLWPCDIIVASRDATFSDPGAAFGANGGEYFVHAWELGARIAKRMLFTGDSLTAEDAHRIGMVTDLVEPEELEKHTLDLARHIATRPMMGLKLAKQAVNQSLDAQGLRTAVQAAFSLHQLAHSHHMQVHGTPVDPDGGATIRREAKEVRYLH